MRFGGVVRREDPLGGDCPMSHGDDGDSVCPFVHWRIREMFRPEKVLNYQVLFLPLKLKGLAIAQPLRNKRNSEFFLFGFWVFFVFVCFPGE